LSEVYPAGADRIEPAELLSGFNEWARVHSLEELTTNGLGVEVLRVGAVKTRSNGKRYYRLPACRAVEAVEPVCPMAAPSPAPAAAQAIGVEPGQKGTDQTSTPGELQALEPACPIPAPAAAPAPTPPPADVPAGERVWCSRTSSLHEVVSRYGPEVQIRPPLPGYPVGQGYSIAPAEWLSEPTVVQLLKGLHTSVDDGPEPLVSNEPVNPSPITPVRVVLSPVPISRAQQPPEGSRLWGDAPCLVNNEPWLLRASRVNGGKEFALLVSADGQRAGSCPMEGVALAGQEPPRIG
jgi:hypothetical protein